MCRTLLSFQLTLSSPMYESARRLYPMKSAKNCDEALIVCGMAPTDQLQRGD